MADKTEFEETLIDLVRQYPCLYLKADDNFRNKAKKEAAWKLIGSTMNRDPPDVREAWNKLRAQYLAFLNKLEKPTGTGAGGRPHFRHEHAMSFCKELTGNCTSFTNVTIGVHDELELSNVMVTAELPDGDILAQFEADDIQPPPEPSSVASSTPRNAAAATPKTRSHSKYQGKRKLDPVDEQLLKVLKAGDQNEDEWDDFGKTLAKKLRRMDAQAPGFGTAAESKIFQLLYDMESQRTQ